MTEAYMGHWPPPHTHACVPTQVQIKEQITGNGLPPPLPWNMYLNGKLLNLYPITNKNGKPWWFVFLSKVLKEILFSGAWGRKGWGREGFFPWRKARFSHCDHFLLKKRLLCLEKLVTQIFFSMASCHWRDDFSKDNLFQTLARS